MDDELKNFLSGLAKHTGLTIEFPDGEPIRISGYQDDDPPFVLISVDQPEYELIFAILQKIGLASVNENNFWAKHLPWFLNRSYENVAVGDVAYKMARTIKQKFNKENRADRWALLIYAQIPRAAEFAQFLKRHPEKMKLMPFVWFACVKSQAPGKVSTCFRILRCLFDVKFT
jgi:hypothetical protein